MKKTHKRPGPDLSVRDDRVSQDDVLAVIADIDNGHEYYMSFVDAFKMNDHDYVVMYNYEPDDGRHEDPEIIILRSERHIDGEQYFLSIKNRKELDAAFDMFFQRFEESGGM
ncbi:MAG: DUF1292 domain-containing protein [Eubacteriales bacterium]|jgi:uncharacterized protein YrzB (UPF0473 family)|nr:DUF1292 domain-containing protein [Eubacteriales bacterium]MDD3866336.1 DUF1292 domain-containing protein [Eubacteriales bacterium]MDD4461362.1 DUF1292 domain-containing protein [Eubacteriales bacterium]